jgi:hypothetical protein
LATEVHSGPRNPGDTVQDFDTEMVQLQGQLFGDPDFDLLRISAGSWFGLPSPGHTTLTDNGNGTFAVDSFFDITYRIEFVGAPGGQLDGLSGIATGTIQMGTGQSAAPSVPGVTSTPWVLLGGLMLMAATVLALRRSAEAR